MSAVDPAGESFSLSDRRRWLEEAASGISDVLVVGGGITGAGVAREAALRGLSVILLDQGDFASGTSSRSSKLIHGGIRYLAQGDIGLVREAARERSILRGIAPHLARPLRMLIPAPSLAGRMKLAAGLWTFERLAGDVDDAGHEILSRASTAKLEPGLRAAAIAGGGIAFTEYATNDARLTLETLRSAAQSGARVANYAQVSSLRYEEEGGVRATVRDLVADGHLEIRARCVVNAAGPWFDAVNQLLDTNAPRATQLTRGIHIVVRRDALPVKHLVVLRAADGRSTFVVPSDSVVYIGTTDTLFEGLPGEPGVSQADVRYLLDAVAATFSTQLHATEIIGTWSGVRPLLRADGKKPSEISRRDEIRVGPGPVVAIAGGKLTTYRRMAERVVDAVLELLGRQDAPGAGQSAQRPLLGGSVVDQARAREIGPKLRQPKVEARLWDTYGVVAAHLVESIRSSPASGSPIDQLDDITVAEIDHAIRYEMAFGLDDVLRRRSRAGMFHTAQACAAAPAVANVMARSLGWNAQRIGLEVEKFCQPRLSELRLARGENSEETAE
jgi:glycerol-3-phosphate dehydrogenase